jgi:transposase
MLPYRCGGASYQVRGCAAILERYGFVVLARRWVVERTLGWLSRARRLNRDHERRPDHHEQMVWWAGLLTLTRRMARQRLHWPERRAHRLAPQQP